MEPWSKPFNTNGLEALVMVCVLAVPRLRYCMSTLSHPDDHAIVAPLARSSYELTPLTPQCDTSRSSTHADRSPLPL